MWNQRLKLVCDSGIAMLRRNHPTWGQVGGGGGGTVWASQITRDVPILCPFISSRLAIFCIFPVSPSFPTPTSLCLPKKAKGNDPSVDAGLSPDLHPGLHLPRLPFGSMASKECFVLHGALRRQASLSHPNFCLWVCWSVLLSPLWYCFCSQRRERLQDEEERKSSWVSQERQKTLDRLRTFKQVIGKNWPSGIINKLHFHTYK